MGRLRVHTLVYRKQASCLASTNYDEGDPFGIIMYNRLPFSPRTSCASRTKIRSCVLRLPRFVMRCRGPSVVSRTLGFSKRSGHGVFIASYLPKMMLVPNDGRPRLGTGCALLGRSRLMRLRR
ncbi:hypothetical protein HAX54_010906 [Datura stramonium]|uniref:Uncharacterized protein n=1 Tax=Datura stramonium TaxID=4076 RepID=A0ABS8TH08_DATST|nr:hypothetical protein [Datura stramonium]